MYTSYTKPNTKDIMVEKAIELFKERGTEAVSIKDICDRASLQTGVVDGQENGAMLTITDNYYETLKYFTNSNHLYGASLVLMNDDYWEALPEEYQTIIQEECYNMRDEARALIAEQVSGCIEQIRDSGVEVTILTDEQLAKWVESGRTVYDKVDGLNQDLVDAFVKAVDELM